MTRARSDNLLPPAIIACVMLLLATSSGLPYGYYQLLRWVICGISVFFALKASEHQQQGWSWGFGLIAVIFNPFIPFYLGKEFWGVIDFASAIVFPVGAILIKHAKS